MELKLTLLGILSFLCHANGTEYELSVVDEEVFSSCQDVAPGTLDINGLLDLSEFSKYVLYVNEFKMKFKILLKLNK